MPYKLVTQCQGHSEGHRRLSLNTVDSNQQNGESMGELVLLGILIGVGTWLYRAGKRTGSRKGYNVGRSRRR